MIYSQLSRWDIRNKRVFIRADLNVPLLGRKILNDFRLNSILPTINYVLNNNGAIILATHIGEPKGYDENLSTRVLIPWFEKNGYVITFAPDSTTAQYMPVVPKQIILLENLRFFPGEKKGDPMFAKKLACTATYYVNDAFGTLHRTDCSIALLPYEFLEQRRSIGFLIENELNMLTVLLTKPKRPFIALLGGGKVADKIPFIEHLLNIVDIILLCPALCFSFLAANNKKVGKSLVDPELYQKCKIIQKKATDAHVKIVLPLDYLIADNDQNGDLSVVDSALIPNSGFGIAIGPKTVAEYNEYIKSAGTIFFNCAMGFAGRPCTKESSCALLHAIADADGTTYIAGGDSTEIVFDEGLVNRIDYLSTGGGVTLAYLSGDPLPGLIPFAQ